MIRCLIGMVFLPGISFGSALLLRLLDARVGGL